MSENTGNGGRQEQPTEEELAAMYADYARGRTIREISEKHGWSERSIHNYKKRHDWEDKKQKAIAITKQKEIMTQAAIMDDNLATANFMINSLIKHVEDFMQTSNMNTRTIRDVASMIDSLSRSIERIVKTQAFIHHGGAEITKVHKVEEKIDWNKLINQSIEAKKEHGEAFDTKKFVKDVVDAKYRKKNE